MLAVSVVANQEGAIGKKAFPLVNLLPTLADASDVVTRQF
jgi:hypothetical protein